VDPKTIESLIEFFIAAAIISGVAIAIGIPCFVLSRRAGYPFCPRWQTPGIPWRNAGVLIALFPIGLIAFHANVAFLGSVIPYDPTAVTYNAEAIRQLKQIRPTILATPLFLVVYFVVRKSLRVPFHGVISRNVLLGIFGWAVLMPLTFAVHFTVLQVFHALGLQEDAHPLTLLRPQDDGSNGFLFALAVCVCTPIVEECLFRGMLVPWAGQRWVYPWILIVAAFLMAALLKGDRVFGPMVFVGVLAGFLFAIQMLAPPKRFPRRTISCILSSAALFAAAHSAVWPTPIPLFVLACGLGYLTARTRSIIPAIVVHGLFNAVSFVMLCRGSAL